MSALRNPEADSGRAGPRNWEAMRDLDSVISLSPDSHLSSLHMSA